ncbi:MAG: hypothetical protein JNK48_17900 [Bryobacterales bacterium]|nr:hypothetical protein [Bryobacterales bacterium]
MMRLRLDPWPAEFDSPLAIEEASSIPRQVDAAVESSHWASIPPTHANAPCCFVDGVRRVEARVLAGHDGALVHGLLGTLAAGYVHAHDNTAQFGEIHLARYLILGKGQAQPFDIDIGGRPIAFHPYATGHNSPDGVLAELQSLMRTAESRIAEQLASTQHCVFVDGLSYRATGRFDVIGVIKRILEPYLAPEQFALVETLRKGERTPLFRIVDATYERYSCFLRLADPRPFDHPLAGAVRIEIGAAVGIERATSLATLAAAMLPRFASSSTRDPRAPQNLLPVGALEQEMRRRMGDPTLLRRAIEKSLARTPGV